MNHQLPEKLDYSVDGTLDVHGQFYTIQGEGPLTGRTAYFIRLAGCNLQCPGCDTEYTDGRSRKTVQQILGMMGVDLEVAEIRHKPAVVITGGEPFRQNITTLVRTLLDSGYTVQIETNGTLPPPPGWPEDNYRLLVVCSPKTQNIHKRTIPIISALKYVGKAGQICADGLPSRALEHPAVPVLARPPEGYTGPVYLQPMDQGNPRDNKHNITAVSQSCLQHGHILQFQTHKIANLE